MCSDLYLLDFLLISFIIIVIIIIIIIIILSPTSASLSLAQFRFRCFFLLNGIVLRCLPPRIAGPRFSGTFLCVRESVFPRVSAPRFSPVSQTLSVGLSVLPPFVFRRLVEKYDPTDCETELPLQAKDFIMFRNL